MAADPLWMAQATAAAFANHQFPRQPVSRPPTDSFPHSFPHSFPNSAPSLPASPTPSSYLLMPPGLSSPLQPLASLMSPPRASPLPVTPTFLSPSSSPLRSDQQLPAVTNREGGGTGGRGGGAVWGGDEAGMQSSAREGGGGGGKVRWKNRKSPRERGERGGARGVSLKVAGEGEGEGKGGREGKGEGEGEGEAQLTPGRREGLEGHRGVPNAVSAEELVREVLQGGGELTGFQQRFIQLQEQLQRCNDVDMYIAGIKALGTVAQSQVAEVLEKRTLELSFMEAREMKRARLLNVMSRKPSGPSSADVRTSGETPMGPRLPAPGAQLSLKFAAAGGRLGEEGSTTLMSLRSPTEITPALTGLHSLSTLTPKCGFLTSGWQAQGELSTHNKPRAEELPACFDKYGHQHLGGSLNYSMSTIT